MIILLGTVWVASLLGSLHCVGMCGPFALIAGGADKARKAALFPTFSYSFGRLVTYSLVGFVFGALGMTLNLGASIGNWQQAATYVAGVMMVLIAFA